MRTLEQRLEQEMHSRDLLRNARTLLVAVSGGLDSMVLLLVLHGLAPRLGLKLLVAHFNHRLRGRSSDADERLVRTTAARLKLRCLVARADVRRNARRDGVSVEMAARTARHRFLARGAHRHGALVVLAHHADDQAELFLLRLLRGAGASGLAGMRWSAPSPADPQVRLIRPLLGTTRAELEEAAELGRVAFREDASNASPEFLRNRVRHRLLPLLATEYQPAIRPVLLRAMDLLEADDEALADLARAWEREKESTQRRTPFAGLALAVQRRVLQHALAALGVEPGFERIEHLRRNPGTAWAVDARRSVRHDGDGAVEWCPGVHAAAGSRPDQPPPVRDQRTPPGRGDPGELPLALGRISSSAAGGRAGSRAGARAEAVAAGRGLAGRGLFGGLSFGWRILAAKGGAGPAFGPGREWFDADRVGAEVTLRHWRPGDRFQPSGMASPVKLQDLFTNARVPRGQRGERVVAVTAGGEIWWVEGLRVAERFKLAAVTRRRLCWSWSRE